MNDKQISHLFGLLERIACALERAHPVPAPISAMQAQRISGTAVDPRYVPRAPTVVWSTPQTTAGGPVKLDSADVAEALRLYPAPRAVPRDPV